MNLGEIDKAKKNVNSMLIFLEKLNDAIDKKFLKVISKFKTL
jgi:hypothetical protein